MKTNGNHETITADFLFKKLRWGVENLPSRQSMLCSYLIDNYSKAAFWTVEELSKNSTISPATIIRTAKSLGYKGYKEMLTKFEIILLNNNTSLWWEMEQSISENKEEETPIWVTNDNIESIKSSLTDSFMRNYHSAVGLLNESHLIFIIGVRSSRATGIFFHSMLSQFMDNVTVISDEEEAYENLLNLTSKDILVVVSLGGPHYAITPINLIRFAYKNGIKTLLITNNLASPAVEYATIALFVGQAREHYSIVPTITLLESFIVDLARLKKQKAQIKLKKLEKILIEQKITF